ncbi:SEL1-like repeat protein [Sulfurovum sp. NBC37-1]|uniref:SEL1-like repeat protein n=1 Tax=Sulfurovum sp. (strain NBC37-1) TaxID=387093 RepID=UPI000158780B|nr:SEL1-like repeat protein [Sulfurovum sp. NBC37-1]BAF71659.1 hypothetical protein SUN_0700 [Sulfurovum sp. NBC37-1]
MKFLMVLIIVLTSLFANMFDDQAYEAYKNGRYKKAFKLYGESYSAKADYNLARFYERGIGTEKNQTKALWHYNKVYESMDFQNYKTCEDEMLPYYYVTLKKLHKDAQSKALKRFCKSAKNPFIVKCPAARVIPKTDRATLSEFDCSLYKRFPKSMKRILHIHAKMKDNDSVYEELLIKQYKSKMITAIRPIISYYIQKETKCIRSAQTNSDVERCLNDYEDFLHKALLSQQVTVGIRPSEEMLEKDPKLKKEMEDERKMYEERRIFLQQKATRKDKEEAVRKLKKLHNNVGIYYQ